ncbi:hypothetical protein D779_2696 [Imhoffiella purpurea]|uniref:Uncharacterized protein n=1 Tax=Imhoffiella purpurea TaxID=1249627 RepID=W9V4E0_9GAMM|nr:hypothetical protein D779_2696 [Imhoffiella purpurea]
MRHESLGSRSGARTLQSVRRKSPMETISTMIAGSLRVIINGFEAFWNILRSDDPRPCTTESFICSTDPGSPSHRRAPSR